MKENPIIRLNGISVSKSVKSLKNTSCVVHAINRTKYVALQSVHSNVLASVEISRAKSDYCNDELSVDQHIFAN